MSDNQHPGGNSVDGDNYPILTIRPERVLEQEAMGSKQKFWFRQLGDGADWLFKYPQPNTGQHWAKKIAAEIAQELEILHAKVELALQFGGVHGSSTESFARKGRALYHGNQVLAGQVLGYDPARKFGQSSHTLANIFAALDRVSRGPEAATAAKQRIADQVRRAARLHPLLFRHAFALLDRLERESVERIVGRVPPVWMSDVARQFAIELTCYNLKKLKEIAR